METLAQATPAALAATAARGLVPDGAAWEPLAGGRSNHVWRIAAQPPLVAKLSRPRAANPMFPNDPEAEFAAMRALSGSGLAPEPVAILPCGEARCLLYTHVPGRPFGAGDDPAGVAAMLARLHSTTPPARLRRTAFRADDILAEGRAMAPGLPPPSAEGLPGERAFLHGDPVPGNLIVGPEGLVAIDWQCPAEGDPAQDYALFLSPAMQVLYGDGPLDPGAEARFLAACPGGPRAAYVASAPLLHWRIAAYCLWRAGTGETAYGAAARAEIARLERLGQKDGGG